jgi:hypothetical protein
MRSYDWQAPPAGLQAIPKRQFREYFSPVERKSKLSIWLDALFAPKPRFALAGALALMTIVAMGIALLTLMGQSPEMSATAAGVTGLVEIKPAGSHEWLLLQRDAELRASDRLRTATGASAVLRFPDDSVTEMGADTQLAILQLSPTKNGEGQIVVLHQNVGQTRYAIQPQTQADSWFEVETSSASVTVVGTEFSIEVTDSQITLVKVTEGVVELGGEESTIRVEAGQEANVFPGAEPAIGAPSHLSPCAPPAETDIQEACSATTDGSGLTTGPDGSELSWETPESTPAGGPFSATVFGQPSPTATATPTSNGTPTATYPPGSTTPASTTPTGTPEGASTPTATAPTSTPTSGASVPPQSTTPPPTAPIPPDTPTPIPATSTPMPPTPVPPTSTPIPPTSTPIPPTPVPPTSTPYPPPTSTPVPPTATPPPPTATSPPPPTPTPPPYP